MSQVFFQELSHQIKVELGEPVAHLYLLQRSLVAVQQGNAVAVLGISSPITLMYSILSSIISVCRHTLVCSALAVGFNVV